MYKLNVLKQITLEDGRLFLPDHPCAGLNAFEVAELVTDHPKHFAPGDELTRDFVERDPANLKHLADAAKQKRKEQ